MAKALKSNTQEVTPDISDDRPWVESVSHCLAHTYPGNVVRTRTMLSCDFQSSKGSLFVPPDMAELQPASLEYLHIFAQAHDLTLIEDRRRLQLKPLLDRRQPAAPMIARAIAELLSAAGLPGKAPDVSNPHRLNDDSPHIDMTQLIQMAAFAAPDSKKVQLPVNSKLANVLNNDTQPITAYASNVKSTETSTILSIFDAPRFRAIGYSSGTQYIVHVCLAGGPISNPQLWTDLHTLTRTDFQFQLMTSPQKDHTLGLFYHSFYFDMWSHQSPWWIESQNQPYRAPVLVNTERKAS